MRVADERPRRGRTGERNIQGHYAGPISRLLAWGADLLIIGVVYTAALALLQFGIDAATPLRVTFADHDGWSALGSFIWAGVYLGNSWVVVGRSPGMSLMGLRIVRSDGAPLDRRHALRRLFCFPLGFLTLGIGFAGIVVGRTRQALYDHLADTAVVYDWDAETARLRTLALAGARRREGWRGLPEDASQD
ncbi:unannotated protein [freshwater metagenome]|uniref:Unannotated protein n=1 Tax=freshwater metagenome TaxID=449393 RepID=A0A6J7IJN0_9ZZZZ|nr:hypothetical protein [Actinomycetota bacterium]